MAFKILPSSIDICTCVPSLLYGHCFKGRGSFCGDFLFLAWSLVLARCLVTVQGKNEWMRPVSLVSDPVPLLAEVESLWNKFRVIGNESLSTCHFPWSTGEQSLMMILELDRWGSGVHPWAAPSSLPSLSMEMSDGPPLDSFWMPLVPCLPCLSLSKESRFRVFPRTWPPPPERRAHSQAGGKVPGLREQGH